MASGKNTAETDDNASVDDTSTVEEKKQVIATKESKLVARSRILVISVLVIFASTAGALTFHFTNRQNHTTYDAEVSIECFQSDQKKDAGWHSHINVFPFCLIFHLPQTQVSILCRRDHRCLQAKCCQHVWRSTEFQ